jgi:hypothetical protein
MAYNYIPSVVEWQHDTSVDKDDRNKDTLLRGIDKVLEAYENPLNDAGRQWWILCELFFRLDYWLRQLDKGNPVLNKKREPVVYDLYKFVVDALCGYFNVTVNVLPRELEYMFGRQLTYHGAKLDLDWDAAKYLSRAEVNKYRLCWHKGRAYQFPWWKPKAKPGDKLALAESRRAYNQDVFGVGAAGWGGFAMSMGRDIYMARHHCVANKGNFYHSSYLGGQPVMCAGTMKIEGGIVRGICTDSGHYQPTDQHMLNVINTLMMVGAPIAQITVYNYDCTFQCDAHTFWAWNGNWSTLCDMRRVNLRHARTVARDRVEDKQLHDIWKVFKDDNKTLVFCQTTLGWSPYDAQQRLARAKDRLRF